MQKIKIAGMRHMEDVDSNASTDTASTLATLGFTVEKAAGADGRIDKADFALVFVETNDVRVGPGTPTTSKGPIIATGDSFVLESVEEIEKVKVLSAVSGVHATLHAIIGYSS